MRILIIKIVLIQNCVIILQLSLDILKRHHLLLREMPWDLILVLEQTNAKIVLNYFVQTDFVLCLRTSKAQSCGVW